jgi:hypothetical protein
MAELTLKINSERCNFIAGVMYAAKTPAEAKATLIKLGVSLTDIAISENFYDAIIEQIKENKQSEAKAPHKPRTPKSPPVTYVPPAPTVESTIVEDDTEGTNGEDDTEEIE